MLLLVLVFPSSVTIVLKEVRQSADHILLVALLARPPGRELARPQHKLEGQKDLEIIGCAADSNFEANIYE